MEDPTETLVVTLVALGFALAVFTVILVNERASGRFALYVGSRYRLDDGNDVYVQRLDGNVVTYVYVGSNREYQVDRTHFESCIVKVIIMG